MQIHSKESAHEHCARVWVFVWVFLGLLLLWLFFIFVKIKRRSLWRCPPLLEQTNSRTVPWFSQLLRCWSMASSTVSPGKPHILSLGSDKPGPPSLSSPQPPLIGQPVPRPPLLHPSSWKERRVERPFLPTLLLLLAPWGHLLQCP